MPVVRLCYSDVRTGNAGRSLEEFLTRVFKHVAGHPFTTHRRGYLIPSHAHRQQPSKCAVSLQTAARSYGHEPSGGHAGKSLLRLVRSAHRTSPRQAQRLAVVAMKVVHPEQAWRTAGCPPAAAKVIEMPARLPSWLGPILLPSGAERAEERHVRPRRTPECRRTASPSDRCSSCRWPSRPSSWCARHRHTGQTCCPSQARTSVCQKGLPNKKGDCSLLDPPSIQQEHGADRICGAGLKSAHRSPSLPRSFGSDAVNAGILASASSVREQTFSDDLRG